MDILRRGRPKRQEAVTKTAVYLTDKNIDSMNQIRTKLFQLEKIRADTHSDIISITLDRYNDIFGMQKAHGKPQG